MNGRILLWSITSALAGFLFGFDTVVISGAEQSIQAQWGLGAGIHGIVMASALYGTVIGSLIGGWPTDRYGRKPTLLFIGLLYIVGAIGSALANDPAVFIAARVIGGLGIGISTVAAPLYISEIAPPKYRGRLAGMFQFNIVFGILMAFLSNALLAGLGENAWRWMLASSAIPALLILTMRPEFLATNIAYCAIEDERTVGFYVLTKESDGIHLDHLWIIPSAMGRGIGRALFER